MENITERFNESMNFEKRCHVHSVHSIINKTKYQKFMLNKIQTLKSKTKKTMGEYKIIASMEWMKHME